MEKAFDKPKDSGIKPPRAAHAREPHPHEQLEEWNLPVESITPPEPTLPPAETAAPAAEGKSFLTKGFLKGLAITAAVVIGVMAIVAGTMGAGAIGGLDVGGIPVTTFEGGLAAGISKGFEFLTQSYLGYAVMAAGSALGVLIQYKVDKSAAPAAPDTQDHEKIRQLTQELEVQKAVNQQLADAKSNSVEKTTTTTDITTQTTPAPTLPPTPTPPEKSDSIYLAGSTIQDDTFRASELKRRVERTSSAEMKAM